MTPTAASRRSGVTQDPNRFSRLAAIDRWVQLRELRSDRTLLFPEALAWAVGVNLHRRAVVSTGYAGLNPTSLLASLHL